jgi:hypothetical protein
MENKSRYRIHHIKDIIRGGYYHFAQVYNEGKWWYIICNHADGGGTNKVKDTTIINIYTTKKLNDYNQIGSKNEEFARKIIEYHKEHYTLEPLKYTYID